MVFLCFLTSFNESTEIKPQICHDEVSSHSFFSSFKHTLVLSYFIVFIIPNNHVIAVNTVLMSPVNPNKYDDFHIHMDYVIL